MQLDHFVPYLLVDDVAAGSQFYVDYLDFQPTLALDWFVSLEHRDRPEFKLDFLQRDHESVSEAIRLRPAGVVLAFVVPDVDREHARLQAASLEIALPLRDEPWGQRRFGVLDPAGVMVELLQITGTPTPEFLAQNPRAAT